LPLIASECLLIAGTITLEASALPWLSQPLAGHMGSWMGALQAEVLRAIACVSHHEAVATPAVGLEVEVEASQVPMLKDL
jgi:hypothetical protein